MWHRENALSEWLLLVAWLVSWLLTAVVMAWTSGYYDNHEISNVIGCLMRPFRDALILTASSFDPASQKTALKVSTYNANTVCSSPV